MSYWVSSPMEYVSVVTELLLILMMGVRVMWFYIWHRNNDNSNTMITHKTIWREKNGQWSHVYFNFSFWYFWSHSIQFSRQEREIILHVKQNYLNQYGFPWQRVNTYWTRRSAIKMKYELKSVDSMSVREKRAKNSNGTK